MSLSVLNNQPVFRLAPNLTHRWPSLPKQIGVNDLIANQILGIQIYVICNAFKTYDIK